MEYIKSFLSQHLKTLGVLALVLAITVATGLYEPSFVSAHKITYTTKYIGLYGIIAIGAAFVITTGGIDLSMGSLIALTGTLFPILLVEKRLPVLPAIGLILLLSLLVGLIHGLLITKLRLQPFLVTLCGLFIYRGIARTISRDENKGFGDQFDELKFSMVRGKILEVIQMPFVIMILIALVAAIFLNKTIYGRHLLALGRNEQAARFSGIDTDRMKILAYMICSLLTGFAGIMFVLDSNSSTPSTFGNFYELYAIAGAVLGGCSLRGGESSIAGVICGTALVQVSSDAVFFLGVADTFKSTVIGAFILIGVIADELLRRFSVMRRAAKVAWG